MSFISRIEKMIFENRDGAETLEECAKLRSVPFQVVVPAEISNKVLMMAVTAVELGLRVFSGPIEIYVEAPAVADDPRITQLLAKMREREEFFGHHGRVRRMDGQFNPAHPTLGICVPEGIYADAAGWIAAVNTTMPAAIYAEPPAALFAVACAMAKVFQLFLTGKAETVAPYLLDVLNLRTPNGIPQSHTPCEVDLGDGVLFGAGATGNAFGFVMDFSTYKMSLTVVDKEYYERPNEETSLMVGHHAVTQGIDKAEYLATRMNRNGEENAKGLLHEVVAGSEIIKREVDFLIVGTDNTGTRRILDRTGAKTTINAGLGGTKSTSGHVLISIHEQSGYPLSKLYPDQQSHQAGTGSVPKEIGEGECSRLSYQRVSLAAPFVALAGGALLVAACVARRLGVDKEFNYFKIDLFGLLGVPETRNNKLASQVEEAIQAG